MKSKIRLVSINLILTALFLVTLNFVSNFILFLPPTLKSLFTQNSGKSKRGYGYTITKPELPNFVDNRDLARLNFQEIPKSEEVQYAAFVGWSRKPFQGKTITVDNNSYRVHKNTLDGEHSDKAVYFFGGSTMWGHGVTDEQTIPALFNSVSGMPSYNRGEAGFTSRQSLARFINLLAQGAKIDVAIFYEGVNDIGYHCLAELNVNEHGRTAQFRKILENHKRSQSTQLQTHEEFTNYLDQLFLAGTRKLATKISTKLFNKSAIAQQPKEKSKRKLSIDSSYICDNSKKRAKQVAETLVNNWEIAKSIAEANGITFIAIWQPVAFIGEPKLDHLQSLWSPNWEDELRLQHESIYPLLKEVIRERGHRWILDYTDMFSRNEYIYWDYCHVSKNGNLIIAKELYADIKPELK